MTDSNEKDQKPSEEELRSKLCEGLKDVLEGRVEPFDKEMSEIREDLKI